MTSDPVAIPKLRDAVFKGTHFKTALLDLVKTGTSPVQYLKITMADVVVSSAKPGLPNKPNSVTFTVAFTKETFEYSTADATGTRSAPQTPPATFDLKNAKVD